MNLDEMEEEEIEAAAEKQGWRNDPDHPNFKTAREFLEVGKNIAAVSSERLDAMQEKLDKVIEASNSLSAMQQEAVERARKEGYEQAKSELHQRQLKAVDDGDQDEYKKLRQEEEELDKEHQEASRPVETDNTQALYQSYMQKNKDLHETREGHKAVEEEWNFLQAKYKAEGREPTPDEFFKAVYEGARERVNGGSNIGAIDDTGSTGATRRGKTGSHTYSNLPPDAKKACDDFIKTGLLNYKQHLQAAGGDKAKAVAAARKQYCESYDWSET